MEKIKVFQGLSEVAGQSYYSVKGLRELGVQTHHIVWMSHQFQYNYDISLNIDKSKIYFLPIVPLWILKLLYYEFKILKENDVFHFHFGRSLLFNFDLFLFRKFKKKVFYEFHGSDLRDYKHAKKVNKYAPSGGKDFEKDYRKRTKKICRYADGIILHDDELVPYLPANNPGVYVVPLRIDLQKIVPVYVPKECKKVRIVHAPTSRDAKGSDFLIKAVEKLQKKYEIELILVENMTQNEALKLYKTADVIVDQLRIGTYGVFAIESMALGKPVITYITEKMKRCLPKELPICSANPDTIMETLEMLIQNGEMRYDLGMKGRAYAEKYHDYRKNAKMLYDIYLGKLNPIRGREAFKYASEKEV